MSDAVATLAAEVRDAERVVWLTGAGISVASGIPPYRTGSDAVWSRFVTDWGTRRRFHADTLAWWRDFWLGAHDLAPLDARPNPGHDALTRIVGAQEGHLIITQNVDGLHAASGAPADRLIEIHGRHGLYRCTERSCVGFQRPSRDADLSVLDHGGVPRCTHCGAKVRPLVLLFDELYDSHPYFRSDEAFEALHQADVIVFVGTSFAVGVTEIALETARRRRVPCFNVNVAPFAGSEPWLARAMGRAALMTDVLGASEDLLPRVVAHFEQE